MSATTEPTLRVNVNAEDSVMGRYQNIVRRRLLVMLILVLAIVVSLVIDFIMGPSGLSLGTLWKTLFDAAAAESGHAGDCLGYSSALRADGGGGRYVTGPCRC